ncbi:hypothetical protein SNEBB_006366 [Seison nebaliae]|nr:hypothetical protein SNEBB_006366 [Seison nebaliae]
MSSTSFDKTTSTNSLYSNISKNSYDKSKGIDKIKLPTIGRVLNSVPYPATHRLTIKDAYGQDKKPKIDLIKKHFYQEGRVEEDLGLKIIQDMMQVVSLEQTLLSVTSPVLIFGDIHGQYYDMIKTLDDVGLPEGKSFLFLGDYVDRGLFSVECFLYLCTLKIHYPKHFFMLRGNHECRRITRHFTFYAECLSKISNVFYLQCMEAFDCLPLAAVVDGIIFCVHGGISEAGMNLKDILSYGEERFADIPSQGLVCDLTWSDPMPNYNSSSSKQRRFQPNRLRGCAYQYGYKAVEEFLQKNHCLCIIRAHEVQNTGCTMYKKSSVTKFPSVITLFSAPNYCDVYKNLGAYIRFENSILHIHQFSHSPHPYILPNLIDAINWSLPYIMEKVTHMLVCIMQLSADEPIMSSKEEQLKTILGFYSSMRENSEVMLQLQGLTPISGNTFKYAKPNEGVHKVDSFEMAKQMDADNERVFDD